MLDWNTCSAFFTPSAGQVIGSITLIATGFVVTMLIDLIGRKRHTS